MHYKFCPECGEKLTDRPAGDDGLVPFCESCDTYHFDSFPSCVIILVANEYGELTLLRQEYLSDRYATFVAGYISPGETAEEAAYREVREEIGIELEEMEAAGTYWFDKKGILMHGFLAYTTKKEFVLSSEVDSAAWVPAEQAPELMFPDAPGNSAHALYRKYMEKRNEQQDKI